MERTVGFLVDELKVVASPQAEQRVFFVSAKETLHQRLNEAKGQPNNSKDLTVVGNINPICYISMDG